MFVSVWISGYGGISYMGSHLEGCNDGCADGCRDGRPVGCIEGRDVGCTDSTRNHVNEEQKT